MTDILLIFPPQWSPFQPPLSLPSLSAWLKRAGYQVKSLDLNILFYDWLLSDACADILMKQVQASDCNDANAAFLQTFQNVSHFRHDLHCLQQVPLMALRSSTEEDFTRYYLAIASLSTYLYAISDFSKTFAISPHEFRLASGKFDAAEFAQQAESPPELIDCFLKSVLAEHILPAQPKMIGLSCIGQQQLYFTLLLGSLLKPYSEAPVIVGGTTFSRIFERGGIPLGWFGQYFDIIVRNEGERPAEHLLSNLTTHRPLTEDVPGIVYRDGTRIVSSTPCAPLKVAELPIPDFDDLPVDGYLSPDRILPLLSARGCYWGKCEFCHVGMVYGGKYAPYTAKNVLETVKTLSAKYGVKRFMFNDEALPPKMAREMGQAFPPHRETGWTFDGIIKFEPYYQREDFVALHDIGFRSLCVGLESASERVLSLMKKNCKRETMLANLTDATESGIWMHCFLFFGFPGETEEDARETYEFIINHSDIVGSFGVGTFSLEHNAPMFHHYEEFGVQLDVTHRNDLDVYYDHVVTDGISADRAVAWRRTLLEHCLPKHYATKWIPHELWLCILSAMTPHELVNHTLNIWHCGGLPASARLADITTIAPHPRDDDKRIVINRVNGRHLFLKGKAATLFELGVEGGIDVGQLRRDAPMLFEKLARPERA